MPPLPGQGEDEQTAKQPMEALEMRLKKDLDPESRFSKLSFETFVSLNITMLRLVHEHQISKC